MQRPRILINALSVTQGGARSYAVNLIRELDRDDRGFDVTILLPPGELTHVVTRRVALETVRLPTKPRVLRVPGRVLYEEVTLPFRARHFDLLYCFADMAPVFCSTPTVAALRNLNVYDHRFYDTVRLRLLERLVRIGLRSTRRVVFPSRAAAEIIGTPLGIAPERIAVVPHGITPAAFEDAPPPHADAPYVFLPAALERHKNIGVLIESLLHVSAPELELWLAGPGETDPPYARRLRQQVDELGLSRRVRFLGKVPYEEILGYYRGSVALVFPSLLETFGHPLLEAMLVGTPVVAASIPAFHEVAGDVALYFQPDDPVALAHAIDRVGAEPEATRARVEIGRERALEFSWKRSADALCRVFEEVLRGD